MIKKTMKKGFTLIELMIVVAIIGILAAIAIPNFLKFQARSKQGEVKSNLKALGTAEKSYYQENDEYTSCVRNMGFNPERGNRYRYTVNTTRTTAQTNCSTQEARATAAGVTANTDGDILVDVFKYTQATATPGVAVTYSPVTPSGTDIVVAANLVGVTPASGGPYTSFGAAAGGNIDGDDETDLWYISSVASTTAGVCPALVGKDQNTPGLEPKNTYNDVNCP